MLTNCVRLFLGDQEMLCVEFRIIFVIETSKYTHVSLETESVEDDH